jgi:glycosyltransferase involved in cell wall biosynthesis
MTIDISLANGLTGIVIFLYELSRTSQNDVLVKFTDNLVDRILRDFNHLPYTFSDGIIGLACGIQYLIDNRFLEANEDVFEELDIEIFKLNRSRYKISNNYSDYCGPILYYLSRISNNKDQKWINEALIFIEKNIVFSIKNCNQFNISGKYIISLVMSVAYIPKLSDHIIKKIDIFISSKLDQLPNSELFVLNFLVMKSDNFTITKEKIKAPERNDFLEIAKIVQVLGIIDRDISAAFKTQIEIATSQMDFNKSQLGLAGLAGLGLALIY